MSTGFLVVMLLLRINQDVCAWNCGVKHSGFCCMGISV